MGSTLSCFDYVIYFANYVILYLAYFLAFIAHYFNVLDFYSDYYTTNFNVISYYNFVTKYVIGVAGGYVNYIIFAIGYLFIIPYLPTLYHYFFIQFK